MAHDEAPIGKERTNSVILVNSTTTGGAAGEAGRIVCSGAKLHLDTGSAWEIVTSS